MIEKKVVLTGGTPGQPKKRIQKTYFIGAETDGVITAIKIGRAINPLHRLKVLSTGSAQPLKLLHVVPYDCEAILHRRFAHLRTPCGEFFTASPALTDFIQALMTAPTPEPLPEGRGVVTNVPTP